MVSSKLRFDAGRIPRCLNFTLPAIHTYPIFGKGNHLLNHLVRGSVSHRGAVFSSPARDWPTCQTMRISFGSCKAARIGQKEWKVCRYPMNIYETAHPAILGSWWKSAKLNGFKNMGQLASLQRKQSEVKTAGIQRWGFRDGSKYLKIMENIRPSRQKLLISRSKFSRFFHSMKLPNVAISHFSKDILREKRRTWEVIRTSKGTQRYALDMSGAKRSSRWSLLPVMFVSHWLLTDRSRVSKYTPSIKRAEN